LVEGLLGRGRKSSTRVLLQIGTKICAASREVAELGPTNGLAIQCPLALQRLGGRQRPLEHRKGVMATVAAGQ
jgi:hypothetical protein